MTWIEWCMLFSESPELFNDIEPFEVPKLNNKYWCGRFQYLEGEKIEDTINYKEYGLYNALLRQQKYTGDWISWYLDYWWERLKGRFQGLDKKGAHFTTPHMIAAYLGSKGNIKDFTLDDRKSTWNIHKHEWKKYITEKFGRQDLDLYDEEKSISIQEQPTETEEEKKERENQETLDFLNEILKS